MNSVLIPTIGRPWLPEAEASARRQAETEVIVEVDTERTGQCATLNRALKRAKGEYVAVLHDDDYYMRPDALTLLRATLDRHPDAAAAYSLPQYVNHLGVSIPTPDVIRAWATAHPVVTTAKGGLLMHGGGILYRRSWIARAGPWDESLTCCEEWEFHLRLLSLGGVFVCCPVETVAYRVHKTQKSSRRGLLGRRSTARLQVRHAIAAKYRAVLA
jgi:GT2 family glycosyltransferase